MNPKAVVPQLKDLVEKASKLPASHPEYGRDHLLHIIREIESGRVSGEKAHRWLGWLQCALVIGGATTLEAMKAANKTE